VEPNKDVIRQYLKLRSNYTMGNTCPFHGQFQVGPTSRMEKYCLDYFCGTIFPKWRKAELDSGEHPSGMGCPCLTLSKKYVKRKFRKWLKE